MLTSRSSRTLKLSLCLVLSASLSGIPTMAGPAPTGLASLEGQVISLDGDTPVAGVVLQAYTAGRETVYRSAATDESGHFALRDLPAGDYGLAIETSEGTYESPGALRLAPGRSEQVMLGLAPAASEDPVQPGVVGEEEDEKRPGMTVLKNPLMMTLISLGGLALIAWGIDSNADRDEDDSGDTEQPESPSAP